MALFRKDLPQQLREQFFKSARTLHKTARGKQILNVFKADYIQKADLSTLDEIRKAYKTYLKLKQKG